MIRPQGPGFLPAALPRAAFRRRRPSGAGAQREASSRDEIERGMSLVRTILAILAGAVVAGARVAWSEHRSALATVVAVGAATAGIEVVDRVLSWRRVHPRLRSLVLQLLDCFAAVGLVTALDVVVPQSGWVLLATPLVIAALRFGTVGVLVSWAVTVGGYLALIWCDLLSPGRADVGTAVVLERPATLLGLAAVVAVLARWLQAGWDRQIGATERAERQRRQIEAIADAAREMRAGDSRAALRSCVEHLVVLGYDAATADPAERAVGTGADGAGVPGPPPAGSGGPAAGLVAGDRRAIPRGAVDVTVGEGEIEVVHWRDGHDGQVFSVSILEPISAQVVTGWSRRRPDALLLEATADLVLTTTSSVELAELLASARYEANHDPLTGLANRAALDRWLRRVTAQAQPLALVFIDIDFFKQVNDELGHQAGDDVLVETARRINHELPRGALAARYGGDELVVAFHGAAAAEATSFAQRLWQRNRAPIALPALDLPVGLSIGVAVTDGPIDPAELERAADEALYEAKRAGRDRVWVNRRERSRRELAEVGA